MKAAKQQRLPSWMEAERILGERVDRRLSYTVHGGVVYVNSWATGSCSGCLEPGDYGGNLGNYPYDTRAKCYVGAGCSECGYTGKRRQFFGIPYADFVELEALARREQLGAESSQQRGASA